MRQGGYEQPAPQVWGWYVAYALSLAVVYLGCVVASVAVFVLGLVDGGRDSVELVLMGTLLTAISVPLMIACAAAPFLPRKPWAWVYHVVLICLGLTSACCLPVCIPLLLAFLKPEVKGWFGRQA